MDEALLVKKISEVMGLDGTTVGPTTALPPVQWDSGAILATMAVIDELFGVTVPTNELRDARTIGDVLALVREATGGGAP